MKDAVEEGCYQRMLWGLIVGPKCFEGRNGVPAKIMNGANWVEIGTDHQPQATCGLRHKLVRLQCKVNAALDQDYDGGSGRNVAAGSRGRGGCWIKRKRGRLLDDLLLY
jgi:hypothetical protein